MRKLIVIGIALAALGIAGPAYAGCPGSNQPDPNYSFSGYYRVGLSNPAYASITSIVNPVTYDGSHYFGHASAWIMASNGLSAPNNHYIQIGIDDDNSTTSVDGYAHNGNPLLFWEYKNTNTNSGWVHHHIGYVSLNTSYRFKITHSGDYFTLYLNGVSVASNIYVQGATYETQEFGEGYTETTSCTQFNFLFDSLSNPISTLTRYVDPPYYLTSTSNSFQTYYPLPSGGGCGGNSVAAARRRAGRGRAAETLQEKPHYPSMSTSAEPDVTC